MNKNATTNILKDGSENFSDGSIVLENSNRFYYFF